MKFQQILEKLLVFVLTLVCVLGVVGCGNRVAVNSEVDVSMVGDQLPKGLIPIVLVNGKNYHWTGMSKLPDGYNAVGEISSITEEVPSEELQLMAGFEATGTVFTKEQTPEVIYVLMTTSWFEDSYIRFVSDDLHDNECISYHGTQYRFSYDVDICEKIEELPEECVLIGKLKYIGSDNIPFDDLETNCTADGQGKFLGGREVYADPNDNSKIYVCEHQYSKDGDYSVWRVCKPWPE